MKKQETKRVLDNLKMPKQQEIFTTVTIVFHSCIITLPVLENVFVIILLWASEDIEKLFTETVYKRSTRKEEAETRGNIWDSLKNA